VTGKGTPAVRKPTVNRISHLPSGIESITPVSTATGVELPTWYGDGSVYIAALTDQQAETLYGLLRWNIEGKHLGGSPAS